MATQNLRFLEKAATLYYKDGLSQQEIAKRLGTSRSSIGRALRQAQKEGYIRIVFSFPSNSFNVDLERTLENKLNLQEVIIAEDSDDEIKNLPVAREAALYIARTIKSHDSIGITWGRTMESIIKAFEENDLHKDLKISDIEIVPLTGTSIPTTANVENLRLSYSPYLASKFTEILNAVTYSFPAPLYVRSKKVRDILLEEPEIKNLLKKGRNCSMAVFGIGLIEEHSSITALDEDLEASILDLNQTEAIGEIMGHTFDRDGNPVKNEFSERIIGISLNDLSRIPKRVAVAYGTKKANAIYAGCKSGIVNTLITDSQTAFRLLEI